MADIIDVPTYEQIATILSKLATNYSNLASVFYDVFYSTEPADVTFQMYDESGVLQTYTIPNRAKDMAHLLNGEGNPEGEVDASTGTLYQDLAEGELYIKETTDGKEGWDKIVSGNYLSSYITRGIGNPDGIVIGARGALYIDESAAALYIKSSSTGSIGWTLISPDVSSLANVNLSNLSEAGEAHFANPSLTNLSEEGQQKFDSLIGTNRIISIPEFEPIDPSDEFQVPTALSTYNLITSSVENLANKQLNNLTAQGELRFIDWSLIGGKSCILSAPDGEILRKDNDTTFHIPAGSVILFPNGVASGKYNNIVDVVSNDISGSTIGLADGTYSVFAIYYSSSTDYEVYICAKDQFSEGFDEPLFATPGKVYFNKSNCQYNIRRSGSGGWEIAVMTLIGEVDMTSGVMTLRPAPILRLVTSDNSETMGTEDNWYRYRPDGWLEQGGYVSVSTSETVIFKKPFKSANYTFVASPSVTFTKTADSVTITGSGDINWTAQGWGV